MFINISDDRVRTEELQRRLRYLSFARGDEALRVSISGTFDPATTNAVIRYQQISGLPKTGMVDQQTWDAITEEYSREVRRRAPVYIYPIPQDPFYATRPAERSDVVLILQVILGALRQKYDYREVPLSGVYGPQTVLAIRRYQGINGLPETGEADRETWRRLSEEYNGLVGQ